LHFSYFSIIIKAKGIPKFQRLLETANEGKVRIGIHKFQFLSCSTVAMEYPTRHPQQGTPNGSVIMPRRELATVSNEERVALRCKNLGELGILIERNGGFVRWENHRSKWWIFQQAMFDYRRVVILRSGSKQWFSHILP
jgi:hypothetical protein